MIVLNQGKKKSTFHAVLFFLKRHPTVLRITFKLNCSSLLEICRPVPSVHMGSQWEFCLR